VNFTYPKTEKLKSKKTIESLFTEGKSVAQFPLRIVYVPLENETENKVGASVSKKYFKKAVDRNYYKRVLRECYRLNKTLLFEGLNKKYAVMLFYQTRERLSYQEVNAKILLLFEKFNSAEKTY